MLMDRNFADRHGSADWTIDPAAPAHGKKLFRAARGSANDQASSGNSAPSPSLPLADRRAPNSPRDRRARTDDKAVAELRASEAFQPFFGVSFVAILVTAALLMLGYRYFVMQSLVEQTGTTNKIAANAAAASNHEEIANYLARRQSQPELPFPDEIAAPLYELVKDTAVDQVRVIDANRKVVFTTGAGSTRVSADETQVIARALAGEENSNLHYRDMFNAFAHATNLDEDNMVVTGLPLMQQHQGAVLGVFEIRTNVNPPVKRHELPQLLIAGTASLLMLVLYGSLLATIRRIGKLIDIQQDALRQRSNLLTELSCDMMNVQEQEKQQIATDLHERVAQTLAAVKLNIESASADMQKSDAQAASTLQSLLTPMHDAILEVRATASGLRPSSLDDLGLLPTLNWLLREFAGKRPDIELEHGLFVAEHQIPETLRPIVYRVAEDACAALARNPSVRLAAFLLAVDDDRLILRIRDDASPALDEADPLHPYARMRERVLLSNGEFASRANSWGGIAVKATWQRTSEATGEANDAASPDL